MIGGRDVAAVGGSQEVVEAHGVSGGRGCNREGITNELSIVVDSTSSCSREFAHANDGGILVDVVVGQGDGSLEQSVSGGCCTS